MARPGFDPQSPGQLANILFIRLMAQYILLLRHMLVWEPLIFIISDILMSIRKLINTSNLVGCPRGAMVKATES